MNNSNRTAQFGFLTQTKAFLKSAFPRGASVYGKVKDTCREQFFRDPNAQAVFSEIYEQNLWGDPESVSGRGSTLERTAVIRRKLPLLLREVDAKSLLDAPCGDFNWMRYVDLGSISYTGADIVPNLIARNQERYGDHAREFLVLDITKGFIPKVSVILCRDCFTHLSFRQVRAAIENFKRSGSEYLFVTTHSGAREHRDIPTGQGHYLNLQLAPFNFPEPLKLIVEDEELGKCLGIWSFQQLRTTQT